MATFGMAFKTISKKRNNLLKDRGEQKMTSAERLAYSGEQVLCFIEEITKLACPKCGECNLSPTIVGSHLVIRCSEALSDYMAMDPSEPQLPNVCDFAQVIKKVSLASEPFTWANKKGRPTQKNIPRPRRARKTS